jgi:hypothetical protein
MEGISDFVTEHAPPPPAPPALEAGVLSVDGGAPAIPWRIVPVGRTKRRRSKVLLPAAIGAAGLIVAGVLAGFLVATIGQLDATRRAEASANAQLASTRAQLANTRTDLAGARSQLSAANQDISRRRAVEAYLSFFFTDEGLVQGSTATLEVDCRASSTGCAAGIRQIVGGVQKFQADRAAITVPPGLETANTQLQTALDQYIAGFDQLAAAVESGNQGQFGDAITKLHAADIAFAAAVSAIGASINSQER